MKILQVVGGLGVGGVETWLMEVHRRWSKNATGQMDYLLTSAAPDHFDAEAATLGAKLYYLKYGRGHLRKFIAAFRQLLRSGGYDAIHDHADYAAGWRFAMAGGVLPPVRVSHVHNPWLHIQANYAISRTRRFATATGKALVERMATHICGTSAEILTRYGFAKGHVLHCGIDVGKFNAPREEDRARILAEFEWPSDTRLVLFVGRLDRALEYDNPQNHKNSWFALNVARSAVDRDPSVRLVMAGDGPSRLELENRVAQWGMSGRLRLPGIRDDVPALMRAADVLLFPSAQEGLGMAAVEAQAAALPVLASTAVPKEAIVIPEMYEALPLKATVLDWAEKLLTMVASDRPKLKSCRAALEASDFSIANSSRRLELMYRSRMQ